MVGSGRLFYGWWIVAAAFTCHCVQTGLVFYAFGVFLPALGEAFGGRGPAALGFSVLVLTTALYAPAVGRAVDRYGPRPVELVGAAALAAGFFALSRVRSLPGYYLTMAGPIAFGSTSIGSLPNQAAVARWFVRQRGKALGVSTAGISMGGLIFVPLAHVLLERLGWRAAYAVLAAVVVAVVGPPVALLMRRSPEDIGLGPDGEPLPRVAAERGAHAASAFDPAGESPAVALPAMASERSLEVAEAVRHPDFWLLALAFALSVGSISTVLLYQIPILVDHGVDPARASLLLGATAGMGVVGKLGLGVMLDRYEQRAVAIVCLLLQAAGIALLPFARHPASLAAYVMVYGYAMGGNSTIRAALVGSAFGRLHYGAIAGRMSPLVVLAQSVAVPAAGYLRDHAGSYVPALAVVFLAVLAAAALVSGVKLPGRPGAADSAAEAG